MFGECLQKLKNDIQYHKRDREQLMVDYINQRLNKSLISYYKTLNSAVYAVSVADPEKVIKEF